MIACSPRRAVNRTKTVGAALNIFLKIFCSSCLQTKKDRLVYAAIACENTRDTSTEVKHPGPERPDFELFPKGALGVCSQQGSLLE